MPAQRAIVAPALAASMPACTELKGQPLAPTVHGGGGGVGDPGGGGGLGGTRPFFFFFFFFFLRSSCTCSRRVPRRCWRVRRRRRLAAWLSSPITAARRVARGRAAMRRSIPRRVPGPES